MSVITSSLRFALFQFMLLFLNNSGLHGARSVLSSHSVICCSNSNAKSVYVRALERGGVCVCKCMSMRACVHLCLAL